jgi:hypothetical protein
MVLNLWIGILRLTRVLAEFMCFRFCDDSSISVSRIFYWLMFCLSSCACFGFDV